MYLEQRHEKNSRFIQNRQTGKCEIILADRKNGWIVVPGLSQVLRCNNISSQNPTLQALIRVQSDRPLRLLSTRRRVVWRFQASNHHCFFHPSSDSPDFCDGLFTSCNSRTRAIPVMILESACHSMLVLYAHAQFAVCSHSLDCHFTAISRRGCRYLPHFVLHS